MIQNYDILQRLVVLMLKKDYIHNLGQMGPKWPKFEGFGHFLQFESLVLADIPVYSHYAPSHYAPYMNVVLLRPLHECHITPPLGFCPIISSHT